MKSIAALITVHNRKEKTVKCLDNLYKQTKFGVLYSLDVYLTDDGCTDGTREEVVKLFPQVTIISGNGDLYWNRGMYTAWKEAAKKKYDFFFWLNDDTFIYINCIERLLTEAQIYNNNSIIVGSTCAVGSNSVITYGGWQNGELISDVTKTQWCDAFNGNIVLIPHSVYLKLGTNDPYYRHASGDTDYGLRAKKSGVPCFTGIGIYGECDIHEHPTVWMNPSKPFKMRWKNFMSPLGNNPFEFYHFKRKHYGLIIACAIFVTNWIHFFLPWLWPSCYKKYGNEQK